MIKDEPAYLDPNPEELTRVISEVKADPLLNNATTVNGYCSAANKMVYFNGSGIALKRDLRMKALLELCSTCKHRMRVLISSHFFKGFHECGTKGYEDREE